MRNALAKKTVTAMALLALVPTAGWAFPGGKPKGPPPEAYAACEGKKVGEAVEFENRRGKKMSAVCTEIDGHLVARSAEGSAVERKMKGDFGKEGKMDGSRRLARLATVLDLTEEQQAKIRTIFEAEREKTAPLREKMAAHRSKLRQAVHAENTDEAAIRALAEEGGALKGEVLVSRARTWREIREILTPAQQEKARQLAALGEKHGEGGCRNR